MQLVFVISCMSLLLGFTEGTTVPRFPGILASRFSSQRCDNANWWVTLDRTTWSVCPKTNTYLRGFWRSAFQRGDERVGRLEEGRCCDAVLPQYAGQPATCSNTDLSDRLNRYNVWALCPSGYFMNGLRLGYAPPAFLNNIDEAKCCHPQNHPSSYEDCYDEDVTISFDRKGWSECQRDGFYMTGFYKSSCDKLYCIEKFRCCKMKNDTTDAPWNKWGDWGECSSPCGDGEQERMRNCSGTNSSMTVQCIGPNKETRPCNDGPCKVKILDCDDADWQASLDRIGWSVCPRDTTFLKGLWRHDPKQGDNRVGRIEYGKCCAAEEPAFINQSSTCLNADWSLVLDRYNVWALCPTGSFMNGLSVGKPLPAFLNDIEEAKCCHPQNHPTSYEDCYDEDVTISFDTRGWSKCQRDGYYMTGFYKSSCDKLYCIEKFRCCKMKNETVVSGTWSDWEDWGECNAVCGDGEQERKRTCTNPSTSKEQFRCSGPGKETRLCNNGPCHVQNCEEADWEASLDQIGWSMCPRNTTFLRGLWRHDPMPGDNRVGRIEFGNCCRAEEPTFINQSSTCLNADWSLLLNRYNVWALCPSGYFMNGLRLDHALPAFLNNIAEAKCCHPQNHPSSFEDCYDEDVTTSFDTSGWSECQQDGFYMTGFYKSRCDKLYCIEKFRCCKMKSEPSPTTQNVKGTSISSSSISVTGNEVENSGKTEPPREKDERTSGVLFQFTWASFGAFVVLVCVVLIEIAMKRIRRKRKDSLVEERNDAYNVFMLEITPEIMNQLRDHSEGNPIETQVEVPNSWADEVAVVDNETYLDQMEIDRNWEIPRERLEILETELGGGEFGVVKKGNYLRGDANKLPVAVKMLKGDKDQKQRMVLIQELEMLRKVGRHKNIVSLVGACSFEEPLCVIIEFVPGGSLDQMLLESRIPARTEDANYANLWSRLSERNLLRIANDVANGMQHLESKLCVHRDLAARNILIGEGLVAKVADFGLSRDISEDGEYIKCTEGRVPWLWMSMESLKGINTTMSDVWSFGVVLWEIVTLGERPYYGVTGIVELYTVLQDGVRLEKPPHCSKILYDIMLQCWQRTPEDRPTFKYLYSNLHTILSESAVSYINITHFEEKINEMDEAGTLTVLSDKDFGDAVTPKLAR